MIIANSEHLGLKKKITGRYFVILFFLLFVCEFAFTQSLPVGTIALEEYYLRKQLIGELDSNISFTVRPISPLLLDSKSGRTIDSLLNPGKQIYGTASGKSYNIQTTSFR